MASTVEAYGNRMAQLHHERFNNNTRRVTVLTSFTIHILSYLIRYLFNQTSGGQDITTAEAVHTVQLTRGRTINIDYFSSNLFGLVAKLFSRLLERKTL